MYMAEIAFITLYGRWPMAYVLSSIAYCLLPIAYCLLPISCCLLPGASRLVCGDTQHATPLLHAAFQSHLLLQDWIC